MAPVDVDPAAAPGPLAAGRPVLRGWLHLCAFAVWLGFGSWLVLQAPSAGAAVALAVYAVSIAALFGVSAAFHRVRWTPAARRRMRRADHATIFVAIAGTYTAVAGLALSGWPRLVLLLVVWVGAVAGIVLRQVWLDAPKWAVAVPYVVVGWAAVLALPQLLHALGGAGFALLAAGGLAYTAGAVVYALRRPDPWPRLFGYHEVFHLCTVVGAALHAVLIAVVVVPLA